MNAYKSGQIKKLKMVIWDLDETLWKGTIDNDDIVEIPKHNIALINALTDHGIINSICSKNDKEKVENYLKAAGLWDLFVFASIDWSAKGNRIKAMIKEIGLRAENVLFIDDNHLNIEEVEFYVPGIITAYPSVTVVLLEELLASDKEIDPTHKRLKQYKILEEKSKQRTHFGSAKEFLKSCRISLVIHTDCREEEERIYELIQRSNQLNFTKKRSSREEVHTMLSNPDYNCGTVWVKDCFGDYGMVGFYAVKEGKAEHLLFSCRTIGMGIEQYVYHSLDCPEISIVGEVAGDLNNKDSLEWINNNDSSAGHEEIKSVSTNKKILLIGGCDLEQTAYYLEKSGVKFDMRFNYVVNKRFECHPDSSFNLRATAEYTKDEKQYLLDNCIFYDKDVFFEGLFSEKYDVVIYSPLIDYSHAVYESKDKKGIYAVYGNRDFPLKDSQGYMTKEEQRAFERKFNFRGGVKIEQLESNLEWLIKRLQTEIILINGAEIDFPNPQEPERYLTHVEMNTVLRKVAERHDNVRIIDVAALVRSESDYLDNIRHYNRRIYFEIANEILTKLREVGAIQNDIEIDKAALSLKGQIKRFQYRANNGRLKDEIHMEGKAVLRKMGLLDVAYKIYNLCKSKK